MVSFMFFILVVTVPWLHVVFVSGDEDMCDCIVFSIEEDLVSCKDFDNKEFQAVLQMNIPEDYEDEMPFVTMDGYLEFGHEVNDDYDICFAALKETEVGQEPMAKCCANVCKSMKDEDAPWWPVVQQLNSTCPLPDKKYPMENLSIQTGMIGPMLTYENCGAYSIEISIAKTTDTDKAGCWLLGCKIFEAKVECAKCPSAQRKK